MNKTLTIKAIKDDSYGTRLGPLVPMLVQTEEGFEFPMLSKDVQGWAIGQKVRYSVTVFGGDENTELNDAYSTIADLVEQGRTLAQRARIAAVAKKGLFASLALNVAAAVWIWLSQ